MSKTPNTSSDSATRRQATCKCGAGLHKITGGGTYFRKLRKAIIVCVSKSCPFPRPKVSLRFKTLLLFFLSVACLPSVYATPMSLSHKDLYLETLVTRDGMELPRQASLRKERTNLSGRACSARQTTVSETVQEPAQNSLASGMESRHAHPSSDGSVGSIPTSNTAQVANRLGRKREQSGGSGSSAPPSQNLQQERTGDAECKFQTVRVDSISFPRTHSSAASTFNPEGAAKPFFFLNETAGVFHTSGTDYTIGRGIGYRKAVSDKQTVSAEWQADSSSIPLAGSNRQTLPFPISNRETAACPRSKPPPIGSVYPKLSAAELYARLLSVPRYFSVEPPKLEGNRFR